MPNQSIKIEMYEKGKTKPAWVEYIEDKRNEAYSIKSSIDETSVMDILTEYEDLEQADLLMAEWGFHYYFMSPYWCK